MTLYDATLGPFAEFGFMRRALVGCLVVALSCGPIGTILVVAGFQALGTLMAVGLMMLPAAAARFWVRELWSLSATSSGLALASGFLGLLVSYHLGLPSGPAIVLVAGLAYLASVALGPRDSLRALYVQRAHLDA